MRIYVGNMSYSVGREELEALFGQYGRVEDVHIPTDRETGRPRGFGFVTMADANDGQKAIEALNGTEHEGRVLKVNEARPKEEGGRGGRW